MAYLRRYFAQSSPHGDKERLELYFPLATHRYLFVPRLGYSSHQQLSKSFVFSVFPLGILRRKSFSLDEINLFLFLLVQDRVDFSFDEQQR